MTVHKIKKSNTDIQLKSSSAYIINNVCSFYFIVILCQELTCSAMTDHDLGGLHQVQNTAYEQQTATQINSGYNWDVLNCTPNF